MKGSVEKEVTVPMLVSEGLPKVSVAVVDRVLLHLNDHESQSDRYVVGPELTRPGIAEACAQHPPNVSRAMRTLLRDGSVEEHTRSIRGEERRQKTWQLSEDGRQKATERHKVLGEIKILLRNNEGELLEVAAKDAAERLEADISLLQILLHAQHEGVLTYGDIRFGRIQRSTEEHPAPGRLTPMTGAHATYNNHPPETRPVHGREEEIQALQTWFDERKPCAVVHGIAGIGKSTLAYHFFNYVLSENENYKYDIQNFTINTKSSIFKTILNKTKIGKNCIIGANALVTENKVIPERSLVLGSPGKVVRQVTDEEIEHIKENARDYVENFKKYKK